MYTSFRYIWIHVRKGKMKAGRVKNKIWDYIGILTESWGPNNSFTLPKSRAAAMPRMCHATSPHITLENSDSCTIFTFKNLLIEVLLLPCYIDKKTKAQRGSITRSRLHNYEVGFELGQSNSRVCAIIHYTTWPIIVTIIMLWPIIINPSH